MRWNAKIDTGGTPPGLKGMERDPDKIDRTIKEIAEKHSCNAEVWWDRYTWFAYVTLTQDEGGDARAALEELEAENVQAQFTTGEKKGRPWAAPQTSP